MKKIFLAFNLIFPILVLAQDRNSVNKTPGTLGGILDELFEILSVVLPVLFILATLLFISGLILYLSAANKEDKQKEARNIMIWGVIILFVIVAVWGLVEVLKNTFDIREKGIPRIPGDIDF